jgi:DNA-binding transcriptional LysR family regulator
MVGDFMGAKGEANRFAEMETFARVVDLGGMTPAAKAKRMSPSSVSKLVARLEDRLQTRLINRSTRQFQLTAEGQVFYESCTRLLADLREAEQVSANVNAPVGRVRVNTSAMFGAYILAPLIPKFLDLHPAVSVDIFYTDATVDLMGERADVAIRTGPLKDSRMIARKLGETRWVIVAAPDYLSRRGTPERPTDLEQHDLITFTYNRAVNGWPLKEDAKEIFVQTRGRSQVGDGTAMIQLALAGAGIARCTEFGVRREISTGRLVSLLDDYNPGDTEAFYAVYLGRGHMPARTRVFLDFLADHVDMSEYSRQPIASRMIK